MSHKISLFPRNSRSDSPHSLVAGKMSSQVKKIKTKGKTLEINTWWGDMAYQLGGFEAFSLVADNDRDKSTPGKDTLHAIFDAIEDPCLILMDEIVAYLVSLGGLEDRHLYDETVQFLQQLIEVVAKRNRCALVFTLPDSPLECVNEDGEAVQQALDKAAREQSEEAFAKTKKVSQQSQRRH